MSALCLFRSVSVLPVALERYVSCSAFLELKKPVFDGPRPPKRPPGPFLLFRMRNVEQLAEQINLDKDADPRGFLMEQSKVAGAQWKRMNAEEQKPYKEEYAELKKKYEAEMVQFYDTFTAEGREDYKKKWHDYHTKLAAYKDWLATRKKKPTKKIAGYNIFVQEMFKERPEDVSSKEYVKVCAEKWNKLTKEEKEKYKELAKERNEEAKSTQSS